MDDLIQFLCIADFSGIVNKEARHFCFEGTFKFSRRIKGCQ